MEVSTSIIAGFIWHRAVIALMSPAWPKRDLSCAPLNWPLLVALTTASFPLTHLEEGEAKRRLSDVIYLACLKWPKLHLPIVFYNTFLQASAPQRPQPWSLTIICNQAKWRCTFRTPFRRSLSARRLLPRHLTWCELLPRPICYCNRFTGHTHTHTLTNIYTLWGTQNSMFSTSNSFKWNTFYAKLHRVCHTRVSPHSAYAQYAKQSRQMFACTVEGGERV